jgi:hypothetical protein
MELVISRINRMIIVKRMLMEYSVIIRLGVNSKRQGLVAVSSELKNEPVNYQKNAECVNHLRDSWSYSNWRQNKVVPICNGVLISP